MNADFAAMRSRYESEDTETLVRIVQFDSERYTEQALEAARLILQERGVDVAAGPEVAAVQSDLDSERQEAAELASRPLGPAFKAICFVFCDIFAIAIAIVHYASCKKRAARQAWLYFGYGWLFRFSLVLLVFMTR